MSKDIQDLIDKLGNEWEGFQGEMKAWQKDLEKKGHADPVLIEKIDKMAKGVESIDAAKSALDDQKKQIDLLTKRADQLEEQLNTPLITKTGETIVPKNVKSAHQRYLRTGDNDALKEVNDYIEKSLNLTVAEQGGLFYSITQETTIEPLIREIAPMRQICDVKTIDTSSLSFRSKTGNTTGGWVGEIEERPETTTPTYRLQEIEAHEMYAQPAVTAKMLEDAQFDVEGDLNEDMAETFGELENVAFISGNGQKKPRGLLTYTFHATPSATQLLYLPAGAAGNWAATDPHLVLLGIGERLKSQFIANAVFQMGRSRVVEVMKFVDGEKRPIWQPSYQAGTPSTVAGFPLIRNEHLPTKAANSLSVLFGDFKRSYRIVDRRGVLVLRDPYTSKPFVKFYTTRRVGGDLVRYDACLAIKFSET